MQPYEILIDFIFVNTYREFPLTSAFQLTFTAYRQRTNFDILGDASLLSDAGHIATAAAAIRGSGATTATGVTN